ncbi:isochorismate synthase [Nocardiopsis composta]|uniref:isochorismate synthase n=1 Tax=Nocardiopsis composta TaxID=157465 RepID=A0A7W8VCX6_9ACTN|nr:isochorismate synthase [Nocardiopsis composta]MBB5431667.1 isochorismate synthase [Nocardiopsis composta]
MPHHPTSPSSLLAAYAPGMSLIATPERTLLGEGALDTTDDLARVPEMLRGVRDAGWHRDPVAIGAVPFAPDAPAHLTVPAAVHTAPPLASARDAAEAAERRALPGPWKAEALPEPEEHRTAVQRAVQSLGPDLEKVVLARSLRLVGPGPVDAAQVLRNLAWRDPAGFTFAMNLPPRTELPGPRTFIGASPELLVAKRGGRALSNPLAGSRPRSADATKDQHNAVELLGSAKDRREHALVVDAVAEGLRPFCTRLDVPGEPELIRTATMWHLSTRVTGELADPDTPSVELARALHPTPAVCGTPTGAARDAISRLEPFDRGFYTGAVGYTDASGDGEWAVAIRCADISGDGLDLYAGGGIVEGSDPAEELDETSAKLRTLLLALGINRAL